MISALSILYRFILHDSLKNNEGIRKKLNQNSDSIMERNFQFFVSKTNYYRLPMLPLIVPPPEL